jgi:hypothetical protein
MEPYRKPGEVPYYPPVAPLTKDEKALTQLLGTWTEHNDEECLARVQAKLDSMELARTTRHHAFFLVTLIVSFAGVLLALDLKGDHGTYVLALVVIFTGGCVPLSGILLRPVSYSDIQRLRLQTYSAYMREKFPGGCNVSIDDVWQKGTLYR